MARIDNLIFRSKIWIIVVAAVMLIGGGVLITLGSTQPYALAADGGKVIQPYSVKAGGKELAAVETADEAKAVISNLKKTYYKGEKPADLKLTPAVSIEKKDLARGEAPVKLDSTKSAVEKIVKQNRSGTPAVTVSYTRQVQKNKKVKYKEVYKKSSDIEKGEKRVACKGKNGSKHVTENITYENGQVVHVVILDEKVTKNAMTQVVYTGTKVSSETADTDSLRRSSRKASSEKSSSNSSCDGGMTLKNGDGQAVVNYAKQFLGNPYVYGGCSLTNGTDCSGFTMSVHRKFGISLPHSSYAQRSAGRGVPYSKARPGDIICYSGHVALYIGNGRIIHASTPSTGIIYGSAIHKAIITVRRIFK